MEMIRLSGNKLDQITLLQSIGFHKKDAIKTAEALAGKVPTTEAKLENPFMHQIYPEQNV